MVRYHKFIYTDYWEVIVTMNGDLIFSLVSALAGLLSITSLLSSIVTKSLESERRKEEALRTLKKQLLELQAMQDSLSTKKINPKGQDESDETEKLINDIVTQLKRYQEENERRA